MSVWNASHNVGGGLVATFALLGVTLFHDWGAKFYFNAVIAAVVAVVAFFLPRDTRQSLGLPPIEERRVCDDGGVLPADDRVQRDDAGTHRGKRAPIVAFPLRRRPRPRLDFFEFVRQDLAGDLRVVGDLRAQPIAV